LASRKLAKKPIFPSFFAGWGANLAINPALARRKAAFFRPDRRKSSLWRPLLARTERLFSRKLDFARTRSYFSASE